MIDYQEFLAFSLENDGTHKEMEIEEDTIEEMLNPDGVLIFVKQDMRRLWIWKGPKAPVRKRFISSRVAAKIQEEIRQESGRHLKIVSVDAGDEPIEFLTTFNLESMEISEKMNDMVYIRNVERDRLKEEEIKHSLKKFKAEEEYWSPILEDTGDTTIVHSRVQSSPTPAPIRTQDLTSYSQKPVTKSESTVEQDKEVIDEVLEIDPPKGMICVNIIIGNHLYAPSKKSSEIFGETMETETWDVVPKLPKDVIDFTTKQIRVITDKTKGFIKATILFKKAIASENNTEPNKSTKSKETKTTSTNDKELSTTKRNLPTIPSA